MPAYLLEADEPFFREWKLFHGPMTRSRSRAKILAQLLKLNLSPRIPVIGVVGSKGKGSVVAAATQYLVASGLRVGTISSPPFLTNRERIRLNGEPVSDATYQEIASDLAHALNALPPVAETAGYLAPTGAFTLLGAHYLQSQDIDVLVIEEGLGGATDEISQFRLDTLVVTEIFLEHAGVIGNTVDEIAENLVGAGDERTARVITPCSQSDAGMRAIETLLPHAHVHTVDWPPLPFGFGPLTDLNVATGYEAARITLEEGVGTHHPVSAKTIRKAAGSHLLANELKLPGRSTRIHHNKTEWFLDAAISADGVRSALQSAQAEPAFARAPILICMPDIKDIAAIVTLLDKDRTILVTTHEDHLTFANYPSDWPTLALPQALHKVQDSSHVIALGTMSFAAEMAAYLQLDPTTWWTTIAQGK